MTSWANLRINPLKKKETIRNYFSSSDDYVTSSLGFLYSFVYTQKNAEPFYVHDAQGYFDPLLKSSQVIHYIKEQPSDGKNWSTNLSETGAILNNMPLPTLRRTASSLLELNPQTTSRVNNALASFGVGKNTFDLGIVLDLSGCVPLVINGIKTIQKRTGKKQLNIFVMTDSMDLLKEFAMKGDPSWKFLSLLRYNAPQDKESRLLKVLAELRIIQDIEFLVCRLSSPLGKLLYLTNKKILLDSQVVSFDGSLWKPLV
jgi:hypothetical protein